MPVDADWTPLWQIPLITTYDAATDELPEWFPKAFRERPGIGKIGKAKKLPAAPANDANKQVDKGDLFAQIAQGRKLKKVVPKPEQKPLKVQTLDENAQRASNRRRGSSADRRASDGTSLSASQFFLGRMMPTGVQAGSSVGVGAHAALATHLFALFYYAPEVDYRFKKEAERRLLPTRSTLLDVLEVEVRMRFHEG